MDRENQKGIVYLFPLLVLFVAVGLFLTTVTRTHLKLISSNVLSESDESGGDNSGSGRDESKVESEDENEVEVEDGTVEELRN